MAAGALSAPARPDYDNPLIDSNYLGVFIYVFGDVGFNGNGFENDHKYHLAITAALKCKH